MKFIKEYPLLLIFSLGLLLRVYNIPQTLLFSYDQGYHGLAIKDIWDNHRIALLGHKTDVEGIFHGSMFYYLMLPLYLISDWNPAGVSTLLAVLDSFSVIILYLIGKTFFTKKVGFLAALLFAVSYSLISYSRWLVNVTPIPFFTTLYLYFLFKAKLSSFKYFPWACLLVAVIAQLNGAFGFFLLLPLIFVFWSLGKKLWLKGQTMILAFALFLLPQLPLILFDIRHQFLVSQSILRMFLGQGGAGFDFGKITNHFVLVKGELVTFLTNKLPEVGILLFFLSFLAFFHSWFVKKEKKENVKNLFFFFLIPVSALVVYPGGIHQFFSLSVLPSAVLVISWGLSYWGERKFLKLPLVILILTIVSLNLYHWRGFLKPGFNMIPIGTRNLITLDDRLRSADFMYQKAEGKPFRTSIYIIPYSQEQPWTYVFSWYGQKKYGYQPVDNAKTFVIYESDYDYPYRLGSWLGKIQEDHGDVISAFKAHDLTVEEREK